MIDIVKLCNIAGLYINGYSQLELSNLGYTSAQYHLQKLNLTRDKRDAALIGWKKDDGKRRKLATSNLPDWNLIPHPRGMLGKHHTREARGKISRRGANHHNWKGGTSGNHYRGMDWNNIRLKCYKRDGYICQVCKSNGKINAHHIVPYRCTQDNSLENLITLCDACHLRYENKPNILIEMRYGG